MKIQGNEETALFFVGLGGACAGVWGEYGWTWALILAGCVMVATAVLALLRRGD